MHFKIKLLNRHLLQRSPFKSLSLFDLFQFGFRPLHSTETAVVKVVSGLLLSCNTGSLSLLLLLDLSSAFDTISHDFLISRLSAVGISGTALSWFSSYLLQRQFYISVQDFRSPTASLKQGVPQGSVLGPLLFIIYILPLGQILQHQGFSYNFYADDIQIYTSSLLYPTNLTKFLFVCGK